MKKVLLYVLRTITIIFSVSSFILIIAGVSLAISEHESSFWIMAVFSVLLFSLFVFLSNKLKKEIKIIQSNPVPTEENTPLINIEKPATHYLDSAGNLNQNIYIENENKISHIDNSPIADEEIPYLIQYGYQKAIEKEKNSHSSVFHRTERENELALNFMISKNYAEAEKRIKRFENLQQQASDENNYERKINLFNQALDTFEKAKKFCYRTKGGMIYFQDLYEHLHNSQNACFSYADIIRSQIDYCLEIHSLEININSIIETNNGYLQKDLYKLFPDSSKGDVQRAVKNLAEKNIIKKTKQGNTYQLTIKGEQ